MVLRDRGGCRPAPSLPGSTALSISATVPRLSAVPTRTVTAVADTERRLMQPEHARAQAPRRTRPAHRPPRSDRRDRRKPRRSSVMPTDCPACASRGTRDSSGTGQASIDCTRARRAARHDRDLVADREPAGLDPSGDDAPVVELVDRLHRDAQRKLGRPAAPARKRSSTSSTVGPVCQAIDGVRCAMPSPWRAEIGMIAVARQAEAREMVRDLGLDLVEARLRRSRRDPSC